MEDRPREMKDERLRRLVRSSTPDARPVVHHLCLVVFPLALLWRALFSGEAFFWGTPLLQFVPWQRMAARAWRSGHLPLWNPLVGCGAPLAANYQTAAFYPLNALYLLLPAEVALSWTTALHLALAGWGMYRWARTVGLDAFPALVGALALQGSGFLVARAALFPSIAMTFPWVPIWLWRAEVLIRDASRRSAPITGSVKNVTWLGLALGLGLMAGHAQTAAYGGLLLASYVVVRAIHGPAGGTRGAQGKRRSVLQAVCLFAVSVVVGLSLAAVQLLPTAELLSQSQRAGGLGDRFALTYSLWPWRLITVLAPNFFGNPGHGDYWGYGTYWEDAIYVGLLPLLLATRAVVRAFGGRQPRRGAQAPGSVPAQPAPGGPLARFWTVGGVTALVLALGKNTPLFPFLFHHVPGFDLFQAPTRWLMVTTVALAALAALGAHHMPRGRRARRGGALAATVGGSLLIAGLAAPSLVAGIPPTFGPATVRLGVVLLLTGILSLLRAWGRRTPEEHALWWEAAAGAFLMLDLLTLGWSLVPTVDRSLYRGKTTTAHLLEGQRSHARVYWPSDPDHEDRAYDAQYRVKFDYLTFEGFGPNDPAYWRGMREDQLPNVGMLDGIASANNFDPLLVGRYVDLLEAAVQRPDIVDAMGVTHAASDRPRPRGDPVHVSDAATFYGLPDAPGRAWVVPRAEHVPKDQTLRAMMAPSFRPTETVLVEERVSGTGRGTHGDLAGARLALQDGPNQVTIRAVLDAPGYLVLADTWYPGWRATVDGEPVPLLRANHAFRTVHLAAGEHVVRMVYRPTSVLAGGLISLMTGVVVIVGIAVIRKERPKP